MKTERGYAPLLRVAALACLLSAVACTTDYVTGKRTFSLVSESQESEMGKEADPQIIAEYGLYDDAELQAYVADIGRRIAAVSHRTNLEYTVRVVDSPIVNAFALPGGYVYITRGILAHFNSEDELAGVMGHEIGHVVARHGAERMTRAQMAGLGLQLGSVVSETFAKYAGVAGAGVGLLFLRYGRDQERESDQLGVEYSTKLGYNAHHMADFFQTLNAMQEQSGQSLPSFLSTHPDPGDREATVNRLTAEWQGKVPYQPLNKTRYDYLKRIEGIVYGDDPRQGFVENNTFYHPQMRFRFPLPAGWKVSNSASTVLVIEPEQEAFVQLTVRKDVSPSAAADAFVSGSGATVLSRGSTQVHGNDAVVTTSSVQTEGGELRVVSYFIGKAGSVYVFHGITSASDYGKYENHLKSVAEGFRDVTDPAVLNKQPRRLQLVQVQRSGTLESALRAAGVTEDEVAEFSLLNGMKPQDRLEKGYWVKIAKD